jgi:hypothetical protein
MCSLALTGCSEYLRYKINQYNQEVAQVMHKISQKDFMWRVAPKSDQDVLNTSLQHMVGTTSMMDEIEQQNWIKDGLIIEHELAGGLSLREVCDGRPVFSSISQAGRGV